MADKGFEIVIDSFYGGMGDTRTMMQPYEFLYGEQIDGYRNPEYLTLTRGLGYGFPTTNDLMLCAVEGTNVGAATVTFFAGENGEIYASNGDHVGTLNFGGPKTIYNMARFDNKILMFYELLPGAAGIATITLANATTGNGSWNANIQPNEALGIGFPTVTIPNRNHYFPYVIVDSYLRFACGKQIGRITISGKTFYISGTLTLGSQTILVEDTNGFRVGDVITITGLTPAIGTVTSIPNGNTLVVTITQAGANVATGAMVTILSSTTGYYIVQNTKIELEDNVVGLTRVGPLFHIYLSSGKTYLWDGFADTAEAGLDFKNTVRFVSNQGKIDYAATGSAPGYGSLYKADGYNFGLIKTATNEEELNKLKYQIDIFNPGSNDVMSYYNSNLYYACKIVTPSDTPIRKGHAIATYGHYYEGFPEQSTIEYIYPDGNTFDIEDIGMIHKALNGKSLIWFSSRNFSGGCRVTSIDASEEPLTLPTGIPFMQSGTYFSRKFDMANKVDKKKIDEFSIMIDWSGQPGETMQIDYALNSTSNFVPWSTITNTTNPVTDRLMSLGNIPEDFYDIKFRFRLDTGTLVPTGAPRIYGFKLRGGYVNT